MIILALERENVVTSIVRSDIPALQFMITRAEELMSHQSPLDKEEGKRTLLSAAHRADNICLKLTALVELEARGRKDPE